MREEKSVVNNNNNNNNFKALFPSWNRKCKNRNGLLPIPVKRGENLSLFFFYFALPFSSEKTNTVS